MSSCLLRRISLSCLPLTALIAAPAGAQTKGEVTGPEDTPPTPAAPTTDADDKATSPTDDKMAEAKREAAKFAQFDKLRARGQSTDFPGVYETVTQDVGGVRTWLNDHNLYFRGVSSNTLTYDVAGTGSARDRQSYTGQNLTASQSNELRLSWKIGGSGEDITQINIGGLFNLTNWRSIGPSGAKFSNFNIYSSFFGGKVEVKAGVSSNISDFVGIFSGGNPILASGLAASIPLSTGMSGGTAPAPSFSLQLNGEDGFYSKSAVQRSLVPGGMVEDAAGAGWGLKLTRPGARPLFIQEFGVRRPASADGRQIWLRGGGTYNLTRYDRLDGAGEERNWSIFALADYQLFQPDREASYRGIYVGASALFAPDAINVYTRSLEGRVYALGMIPGRPTDQMTFTIGTNRFTRSGGGALAAAGQTVHRNQFSMGALYAFHARNGLFISPSVTYIRNPGFVGDLKPALNLATSVAILF